MKIIIIGAGVSGLTFALACQRAGIEVKIYEKTKNCATLVADYYYGHMACAIWNGLDYQHASHPISSPSNAAAL